MFFLYMDTENPIKTSNTCIMFIYIDFDTMMKEWCSLLTLNIESVKIEHETTKVSTVLMKISYVLFYTISDQSF